MKREFRVINMRPESLYFVERCNVLLKEAGEPMTLREIYYQFIGRDWIPNDWIDPEYNKKKGLPPDTNTLKNYKRLCDILGNGRIAGLIDWELVEDREREAQMPSEWDDLEAVLRAVIQQYRRPRWADQPNYVELWLEKKALVGILEPVANEHHIHLVFNKGYGSITAIYQAAQRFAEQLALGKRCYLLYFGDHDPSGEDMVRDIRDRLTLFGAPDVEVEKVALTMDQVKKYNLPPNPAKSSDSRADAYVAEHGNKSWELEALRRHQIRQMGDAAVDALVDHDLLAPVLKAEKVIAARTKKSKKGK